ncbi:MAG: ribosome maturation factor RimP [candidate division Zixibacteria bacterium]|nr:ribosome maturation factor RimP [candidate division Zixibacteria bacterium]
MNSIVEILKEKIEPLAEEDGLEIVDLKFFEGGPTSVLRIYVDKAGGVTVDQCANLSRKIGDFLEIEDLIPSRYTLEVSSPGLDKPLTTGADFKRRIGEKVKVFLREKVGGKMELLGKIKNLDGENLFLLVESPASGPDEGAEEIIPLKKVAKAKIIF